MSEDTLSGEAGRELNLDIDQSAALEGASYRIQQGGWCLMALMLLAALLGLFGDGVLSRGWASSPDGSITVRYDRFDRRLSSTGFTVSLRAGADRWARFWADTLLVDAEWQQQISPRPDSVISDGGKLLYVVRAAQAGQIVNVEFSKTANALWRTSAFVGVPNGDSVALRRFTYP
jgi:hypothetical protein